LKDKYFEMIVPICTYCGKQNYTKTGWRHNKPTLGNGEKVEINIQLYFCHACGHKLPNKFFKRKFR
jgi:hypothetical protein